MRISLVASTLLVSTSALAAPSDRAIKPVAAATQAARIGPRPYGWQGASQLFSYAPGGLYQIYAAVGQVTDIMLQEGETFSDTGAVAAGDTARWASVTRRAARVRPAVPTSWSSRRIRG